MFIHHDADGMAISCGDAQAELAHLWERNNTLALEAGAAPRFERLAEEAVAAASQARAELAAAQSQIDRYQQMFRRLAAEGVCICDTEQVDAGGYWVTKLNADAGCQQHGEAASSGPTPGETEEPPADRCVCGCPKRAHQVEVAPGTVPGWYSPPIHPCVNHPDCSYRLAEPVSAATGDTQDDGRCICGHSLTDRHTRWPAEDVAVCVATLDDGALCQCVDGKPGGTQDDAEVRP